MADVDFKDTDVENPLLKEAVMQETEMKTWLVEYVGEKSSPENNNVTVEMIVEQMAKEFPEFLMAVAEDNFMRVYEQALTDIQGLAKSETDV